MQTTKASSSTGKPETKGKNRSTRTNGNGAASNQPSHEQIAVLACQIYIESGCQEGRDLENWLKAEQALRNKQATWQTASPNPGTSEKFEQRNEQSLRR